MSKIMLRVQIATNDESIETMRQRLKLYYKTRLVAVLLVVGMVITFATYNAGTLPPIHTVVCVVTSVVLLLYFGLILIKLIGDVREYEAALYFIGKSQSIKKVVVDENNR